MLIGRYWARHNPCGCFDYRLRSVIAWCLGAISICIAEEIITLYFRVSNRGDGSREFSTAVSIFSRY